MVWSERGWLDLSRLPPDLQERAITTIYGFARTGEGVVRTFLDSAGQAERAVICGPLYIFVDCDRETITVHTIGLTL